MKDKPKPVYEKPIGELINGILHVDGKDIPVRFDDAGRRILSKHLSDDAIDSLEDACRGWAHIYEERECAPTVGQVRAALANIADLASRLAYALEHEGFRTQAALQGILTSVGRRQPGGCDNLLTDLGSLAALASITDLASRLAYALEYADLHTQGILTGISHKQFGGIAATDTLVTELASLAESAQKKADRLPAQSRAESKLFYVELIAGFLDRIGSRIVPKQGKKTPFYCVVDECFKAMCIPVAPEAAIKLLLQKNKI